MTFQRDIEDFLVELDLRQKRLREEAVQRAFDGIRHGDEITGAPGQPVDTGNLINSWQIDKVSDTTTRIFTAVIYAPGIEDGVLYGSGGNVKAQLTLRSQVGGFHSVKMTVAGWQDIVNAVVEDLG